MDEQKQQIAIAEACGTNNLFVLIKGGLYYRPNACGYTSDINQAWILTEDRANKYVYPHDEPVIKRAAPLPDYLNDFNAIFEAFNYIGRHWEIHQVEDGYVCKIEFGPKNKDVLVGGLDLLEVMAEAFLRTLGKWEEETAQNFLEEIREDD